MTMMMASRSGTIFPISRSCLELLFVSSGGTYDCQGLEAAYITSLWSDSLAGPGTAVLGPGGSLALCPQPTGRVSLGLGAWSPVSTLQSSLSCHQSSAMVPVTAIDSST